jgi:serine/threonine-protein kinase
VLLTTSGKTKLLDFGIARVSRGPLLHKRSGSRALTPAYASCEMLKGEEADRRDDIYSFACVIYEMLSGDRPFGELNALEARDVGTRVPPLAVLSPAQNEALAQALAFDRAARTPSVEQLLAGLVADRPPGGRRKAVLVPAVIATLAVLGFAYLALDKLWISRRSVAVQQVTSEAQPANTRAAATPVAFNPPPHSIAVLPFVNMSEDKEQEYFSDGLSEELLNDLARINELQVAARTSAFSFKGKDTDIGTIAHKLNVGAVLEGSVRRSGNRLRITAQLNNAVTGFHLWSQTYDRNVGDVLQLQTEIASAVASALRVTLLGSALAKIELGGTHDPAAFDAYLRGVKTAISSHDAKDVQTAIAAYTDAIRLDANYALAFARRSKAFMFYGDHIATRVEDRNSSFDEGYADARRAIALAPDLAEGHLALALYFKIGALDFARANEEYERALALGPGDSRVLRESSGFAGNMGRVDTSVAAARHAVMLDPLNKQAYSILGTVLFDARQYDEAIGAYQHVLALDPDYIETSALLGFTYYNLGKFQSARESCETKPDDWEDQECLALTYEKLGRHADAEAMLAKLKAAQGDSSAYNYAEITAQWGNSDEALRWLETALRLRDSGLAEMKVNPFLDPLRKEPRFQAIERELKFPTE